ncbi:SpoIIIAH-like family protein [Jeotgalibacillus soli]|nr:SpoIIIAH-like family protein [Jeotgalibacillus soli]
MLKKQTVWLLTMLSLVVVLSVYYVTSPGDQASPFVPDGDADMVLGEDGEQWVLEEDVDVNAEAVEGELFEVLRMQLQDERNALKEQLTAKVASNEFTSSEKNEAFNEMDELVKMASKEAMMETMIKALDYQDALVRTDENQVLITVIAEEHSKADANALIQLARQEFGDTKQVNVKFQSNEASAEGDSEAGAESEEVTEDITENLDQVEGE